MSDESIQASKTECDAFWFASPLLGNEMDRLPAQHTGSAVSSLRLNFLSTTDFAGFLVMLPATHFFFDSASLHQFSETTDSFLNCLAVPDHQLNHFLSKYIVFDLFLLILTSAIRWLKLMNLLLREFDWPSDASPEVYLLPPIACNGHRSGILQKNPRRNPFPDRRCPPKRQSLPDGRDWIDLRWAEFKPRS